MSEKLYLYPQWVRVWHGLNAILCLVLLLTGLSLQYSDESYIFLLRFDIAVNLHSICGVLLSINYFFFIIGNWIRPNGRYYRVQFKGFLSTVVKQMKYYAFGMFKGEPAPFPITKESKFNPLQKLSYIIIMYLMFPIVTLTGWILMYPDFMRTEVFGSENIHAIQFVDLIHLIVGYIISLFMIIHIYFCTLGKTALSNFKSMINGWHEPH